jgi:hypothetical protein
MRIVNINEDALFDAATFLVGAQATDAIIKLYQLLDKATVAGYELGKLDGERNMHEATNASFDNGYEYGHFDGLTEAMTDINTKLDTANDDGYVQGVSDARARPSVADENVAEIISEMTQHALNGEYEVILVHPPCQMLYQPKNAPKVEGEEWGQYFDADNVQDSGDAQPKTPADYELDELEWYCTQDVRR